MFRISDPGFRVSGRADPILVGTFGRSKTPKIPRTFSQLRVISSLCVFKNKSADRTSRQKYHHEFLFLSHNRFQYHPIGVSDPGFQVSGTYLGYIVGYRTSFSALVSQMKLSGRIFSRPSISHTRPPAGVRHRLKKKCTHMR